MPDHKVVICTPVRGAENDAAPVSLGYCEGLRKLSYRIDAHVMPPLVAATVDSGRARNRMTGYALRTFPKLEYIVWWDDDCWPDDIEIVEEMLACGADVVAAPYTNKRKPLRWVHWRYPTDQKAEGPLMPVLAVGFGLTVTSVKCLREMWDSCRIYTDWPNNIKLADMFGHMYDPHPNFPDDRDCDSKLSEDFSFCRRWRELGHKVYVYEKSGILRHAGFHAWSAEELPGGVVSLPRGPVTA